MQKHYEMLKSEDLESRLQAIQELGRNGDLESLRVLRAYNQDIAREHHALVNAIWKLKRKYFPDKVPPFNKSDE